MAMTIEEHSLFKKWTASMYDDAADRLVDLVGVVAAATQVEMLRDAAMMVRTHLTQPAQAVDVGQMVADLVDAGRVLERFEDPRMKPLSEESYRIYNGARQVIHARKLALTRAMAGEQAGRRDGVAFASPRAAESAAKLLLERFEKRACDSSGVDCCIRCNAVALSRWVLAALPASPTPDKEG